MSAELNPEVCRELAAWCCALANAPGPGDDERLRPKLHAIAAQLTAAADLAEQHAEAKADILRQAARIAALESEIATLQSSVIAALSSAGPEVGEDERSL